MALGKVRPEAEKTSAAHLRARRRHLRFACAFTGVTMHLGSHRSSSFVPKPSTSWALCSLLDQLRSGGRHDGAREGPPLV